jgi:predicted nucleic acid-binding protein
MEALSYAAWRAEEVEIMYLIDTNIFLEILLAQKQKNICKEFLVSNIEQIYISDFSLHSIGVLLFRNNNTVTFFDLKLPEVLAVFSFFVL